MNAPYRPIQFRGAIEIDPGSVANLDTGNPGGTLRHPPTYWNISGGATAAPVRIDAPGLTAGDPKCQA